MRGSHLNQRYFRPHHPFNISQWAPATICVTSLKCIAHLPFLPSDLIIFVQWSDKMLWRHRARLPRKQRLNWFKICSTKYSNSIHVLDSLLLFLPIYLLKYLGSLKRCLTFLWNIVQHGKMEIQAAQSLLFFHILPLHENPAVFPAMFSSFQTVNVNDKNSAGKLSEIDLAPSEHQWDRGLASSQIMAAHVYCMRV